MNKHALAILAGWLFSAWLATAEAACNVEDFEGRWRFFFHNTVNQAIKCALLLERDPSKDFVDKGKQYFAFRVAPNSTNCETRQISGKVIVSVEMGEASIRTDCFWLGNFRTLVDLYRISNALMSADGRHIDGMIIDDVKSTYSAFSGQKVE